jgi:hypothetical protein
MRELNKVKEYNEYFIPAYRAKIKGIIEDTADKYFSDVAEKFVKAYEEEKKTGFARSIKYCKEDLEEEPNENPVVDFIIAYRCGGFE